MSGGGQVDKLQGTLVEVSILKMRQTFSLYWSSIERRCTHVVLLEWQ